MKNALQRIAFMIPVFALFAIQAEGQATAKKAAPAAKPAPAVARTSEPANVAGQKTRQAATPPATAKPATPPAATQQPVQTHTSAAPKPGATTPAKKQPVFAKAAHRTSYLNGGIGLASYWGGGIPIGVSFETALAENLSVGGSVDYAHYGRNYGGYKWSYNFIYAGARGSYHLGEILQTGDKFDPYAGISLGVRIASYKDNAGYGDYYNPYNNGLYLGIHVGGRYYFTEKVGGFAEVGYGVTALRLGVTAKF
ncbi:hypothetical protein [Arsenicibacter rosenii]|uniref:hypothetical protein n=1 Tax=Arsenicibacter rosenii TaxID=1750698 RepID=UPI0009F6CF1A|nr:hypothetical protein [Arsenicibacter rosenii]